MSSLLNSKNNEYTRRSVLTYHAASSVFKAACRSRKKIFHTKICLKHSEITPWLREKKKLGDSSLLYLPWMVCRDFSLLV